jgi:hypothetical protein
VLSGSLITRLQVGDETLKQGRVVCVKFSKKILGMWAQVKPWARSGALGESSAERPQRVRQLAAS